MNHDADHPEEPHDSESAAALWIAGTIILCIGAYWHSGWPGIFIAIGAIFIAAAASLTIRSRPESDRDTAVTLPRPSPTQTG